MALLWGTRPNWMLGYYQEAVYNKKHQWRDLRISGYIYMVNMFKCTPDWWDRRRSQCTKAPGICCCRSIRLCISSLHKITTGWYEHVSILKESSKIWYDTLTEFLQNVNLLESSYVNITLYILRHKHNVIYVQWYHDYIICWSTNENLCKKFSKSLQVMYKMSMLGKLQFFLELL